MEHISFSGPAIVLQNIPVITKLVLQNLPAKSLNTCARVCRAWNTIVKSLKQGRKGMSSFSGSYDDNVDLERLATQITSAVQNLMMEPSVMFMYCTTQLFEQPIKLPSRHTTRRPRATKCLVSSIGDLVQKLLPRRCKLLAVSSDGIVGTSRDLRTIEVESDMALSCLFLPHITGVEFYTFNVNIYNYSNQMDDTNSGPVYLDELSTVPQGAEVKAIFYFCDEPFSPPEIGYTLLQMYDDAVIAGGYVDNLITTGPNMDDPCSESGSASLMCVALCGPRVRVASVLIKEDIRKPEEVERVMKKLKDCNLPEERSYAFMFACIGRGKGHYGNDNVESSVFRKMFPKTPIFGFFGNGEIGFNFLKKYQTESADMACDTTTPLNSDSARNSEGLLGGLVKPLPKLHHAYTTIICMVSVV